MRCRLARNAAPDDPVAVGGRDHDRARHAALPGGAEGGGVPAAGAIALGMVVAIGFGERARSADSRVELRGDRFEVAFEPVRFSRVRPGESLVAR